MRKDEALSLATRIQARYPCHQVAIVADGASMLRERGLPLPAWTVPATAWVVLGKMQCSKKFTAFAGSDDRVLLLAIGQCIGRPLPPHTECVSIRAGICSTCPYRERGAA